MVVFLDLDDEAVEPPDHSRPEDWLRLQRGNPGVLRGLHLNEGFGVEGEERENPNREKGITKALGCYPYVQDHRVHSIENCREGLELTWHCLAGSSPQ